MESNVVQADLQTAQPGQIVILIAEDEVRVREFARNMLQADGYFVLTAGDGELALAISRQFPGTIHILLSDVKMPNLDGLGLRRIILEERPGIRVLLMSGYVENLAEDIAFLAKPFLPAVLRQRIHELHEPRAERFRRAETSHAKIANVQVSRMGNPGLDDGGYLHGRCW